MVLHKYERKIMKNERKIMNIVKDLPQKQVNNSGKKTKIAKWHWMKYKPQNRK